LIVAKLRIHIGDNITHNRTVTQIGYTAAPPAAASAEAPGRTNKLSYCWETVRRESMPKIAEMDAEMTT